MLSESDEDVDVEKVGVLPDGDSLHPFNPEVGQDSLS